MPHDWCSPNGRCSPPDFSPVWRHGFGVTPTPATDLRASVSWRRGGVPKARGLPGSSGFRAARSHPGAQTCRRLALALRHRGLP